MSQSAMWEEEAENHGGYQSSSTIHTTWLHTGNKLLIRLIVIIDIALRDDFLYTIHQKNLNNLKKISAVEQIKRFPKLPFDCNENLEITDERRLELNSSSNIYLTKSGRLKLLLPCLKEESFARNEHNSNLIYYKTLLLSTNSMAWGIF